MVCRRTPRRIPLSHAGRIVRFACVAFLSWDGEDFAVRLKDSARAGRRDLKHSGFHRAGPKLGAVSRWATHHESGSKPLIRVARRVDEGIDPNSRRPGRRGRPEKFQMYRWWNTCLTSF